ncbi:MAG TPA: chromosome segregation protein SMC [Myxococcota bacterium]|nr:chromosome segregation protein SMC [Myxococcota bacterium]
MRLKSLELHGFKSFVDKTAIRFQPGITAVVGPNGCGKSNVVDAMRWVMGEQSPRRLRGKGMDDVIFAGSEGRAPVGMAEVVLSFDNSHGTAPPAFATFAEIQIARRLYRSGESEYLMNKVPCRLRDVQDFFRDTGIGAKGYTIVEQGRIAEIVSAKPEERRILIEEAAGIGKYKARRREAESKIESTQQNLLRVSDVLGEIRRQIASTERQARKAARYKRLRETLRVLELSLAADERAEIAAAAASSQAELQALRDRVTATEMAQAERELAIQNERIALAECERALSQDNEELLALRGQIKDCEGQVEYGRRERETLAELAAARRAELEGLHEQRAAQQREVGELEEELSAASRSVAAERDALAASETALREARESQRALEAQREAASAAQVEVLTAVARAEDRIAAIDDRSAELDLRLRSADEGLEVGQNEAARADREQRVLEEGLRNLLAERDRVMGLLRDALETHRQAVERERRDTARLRATRELLEGRRARLVSLREVLARRDDVAEGTRHLLEGGEEARRRFGLRALVRDVIEVEPELERAAEAVLAERAEALIVQRAEDALAALASLRAQRAGRGIFLSLPPAHEPQGFVPLGEPLLGRVRVRSGFEDLARALFAGVNLVDDLAEVLRIYGGRRLPAVFATRDGDVLTPDGVVRGGAPPEGGVLARVREVRDLEHEVQSLEARVLDEHAAHRDAEQALARAGDELENLRNRHHTAALAVANHEKDLERTRERVKALGEVHESRVQERSDLLAEQSALGEERVRLDVALADARERRLAGQRSLDALGLRLGSAGRELSRVETLAAEQRALYAGREERRERVHAAVERMRSSLSDTQNWIARRDQEIAAAEQRREELARTIESARQSLEARLADEEQARARHEGRREAFDRAAQAVASLEEGVRELRASIARARDEMSQHELRARELEMRREHLENAIREKWGVELASWEAPKLDVDALPAPEPAPEMEAAPAPEGEDAEHEPAPDAAREARAHAELVRLPIEARREQQMELRRKLEALGDVNLGAIEEHEELKERNRFLSEQKQDLESTLTSLRDAIARINRASRQRFRETFEAVAKRFSENFPRLFRGGRASLSLTESEDVLEAGIEILAMPPGKRLQNVNLLSGGEKTLTAIALLVAVFQVRPSPFFLLDEVDAALDDANVGRFNEIVRELAGDSQFVLITHNKRTIEIADVLYGVTMERKGVSTIVSVEMHAEQARS